MYTPFATGIHDGHRESQHASFDRRKVMAESNAKYIAKWKFYFELNKNNPGLGRFK
jgi:hypothetical protein